MSKLVSLLVFMDEGEL